MREIEYRAWFYNGTAKLVEREQKGTGCDWVGEWQMGQVSSIHLKRKSARILFEQNVIGRIKKSSCDMKIGEKCILLEYIGLKKGERKIYDGDILFDEIEGDNGDERHYFVVRWLKEKCSFVFMDYGDTVTNWEKFEEDLWHDWPIQVDQKHLDAMHYAGNIHENYELLLQ